WRRGRLRDRQADVCKILQGGRRIVDGIADTRNAADIRVDEPQLRRVLIADAVARTQDRLLFSKPRKRPAQADSGSKVVPVIFIELLAGIRGTLSDKFLGR